MTKGQRYGAFLGALIGMFSGGPLGERWLGHLDFLFKTTTSSVPTGQVLELSGPTLKGPDFDIAKMRGKVVLIDFWATWCGPCVAELPHLKELYDRHHDHGFEIVGVNLDTSRRKLDQFVTNKNIPWPQIVFGEEKLPGWDSPLARKYSVDTIPMMILVDQEGRVVSGDISGHALETAIADLLGKEAKAGVSKAHPRAGLFPTGSIAGTLLGCLLGAILGYAVGGRVSRSVATRPAPTTPSAPTSA